MLHWFCLNRVARLGAQWWCNQSQSPFHAVRSRGSWSKLASENVILLQDFRTRPIFTHKQTNPIVLKSPFASTGSLKIAGRQAQRAQCVQQLSIFIKVALHASDSSSVKDLGNGSRMLLSLETLFGSTLFEQKLLQLKEFHPMTVFVLQKKEGFLCQLYLDGGPLASEPIMIIYGSLRQSALCMLA